MIPQRRLHHAAFWYLAVERPAWGLTGVAAIAALALSLSLATQHLLGMQPCAWCILQRLVCIGILLASAAGVLSRRTWLQVACCLLVALFSVAGIWAACEQHLASDSALTCRLSVAQRIVTWTALDRHLPAVFEPLSSCSAATLLGMPYEYATLALFCCLLLAALSLGDRIQADVA